MPTKDQKLKAKVEASLDEALSESFPASAPVSFIEPQLVNAADRGLPVVEASRRARRRKARRA